MGRIMRGVSWHDGWGEYANGSNGTDRLVVRHDDDVVGRPMHIDLQRINRRNCTGVGERFVRAFRRESRAAAMGNVIRPFPR